MWLTYNVTKAGTYTITLDAIVSDAIIFFQTGHYQIETITEVDGVKTVDVVSLFTNGRPNPVFKDPYTDRASGVADEKTGRVSSITVTFNEEDVGKVVKIGFGASAAVNTTTYSIIKVDIPEDNTLRVSKGNNVTLTENDEKIEGVYTFTAPQAGQYKVTVADGIYNVLIEKGETTVAESTDAKYVIFTASEANEVLTFTFTGKTAGTYNVKVEVPTTEILVLNGTRTECYVSTGMEFEVDPTIVTGNYRILITRTPGTGQASFSAKVNNSSTPASDEYMTNQDGASLWLDTELSAGNKIYVSTNALSGSLFYIQIIDIPESATGTESTPEA
jgi:hypothetical protein